MDEVAERAGISKPMLYLYLGSKEELFLACIKREADRVRTAIVSALDDEHGADLPPDRALWYGLSAFFAVVAQHRDAWRVLHQQAPAHGEPFAGEVAALRSAIVGFVTVLIERAVAERHPRGRRRPTTDDLGALAHSLIGACEALADWSVTGPDEDPEVTSARLMNFAWLGLDNLLRGTHWPRPR
jgi:AcrR family transcriptional regulator